MLEKTGKDGYDRQHWKLTVPEEHCELGLEVLVIVSKQGISIGDGVIPWKEIDSARDVAFDYGVDETLPTAQN